MSNYSSPTGLRIRMTQLEHLMAVVFINVLVNTCYMISPLLSEFGVES